MEGGRRGSVSWLWAGISACPSCMPSPMHHTHPPHTSHSNTVPYAPRCNPPLHTSTTIQSYRPLQLAQRTCITGTIIRTTIGKYYRTLNSIRGHPRPIQTDGPGAPPRCLATSINKSLYHFPSLSNPTKFRNCITQEMI